jgi:assimilatory nitrate reductase catalytic subunit
MTRTGRSPRLGAHSPEPQVDIHPDYAAAAGLEDGGFARVATQHGSAVLRVCVRSGQQRGSIFAPIHWSDTTASDARVGALVMAEADPFSGQPELKATPARVEPVAFAYCGFALTRELIALPQGTWFARVAVAGGYGVLFATTRCPRAGTGSPRN